MVHFTSECKENIYLGQKYVGGQKEYIMLHLQNYIWLNIFAGEIDIEDVDHGGIDEPRNDASK